MGGSQPTFSVDELSISSVIKEADVLNRLDVSFFGETNPLFSIQDLKSLFMF
jgi:hypothetical protein